MKNQKRIIIMGAGTAGTILANKLAKKFSVTIIDAHPDHYYQPGFLFLPFNMTTIKQIVKPKKKFITNKATYLQAKVLKINPQVNNVRLVDGTDIEYDLLVVATGSRIVPEEIEGLKGLLWQKDIFDFYSLDGALKLKEKLATWQGGRLVVNIAEMPIKCPVAPLEFSFLADSYFKKRKMRDKVEITYVTPLTGAFTKPKASEKLWHLLNDRNIKVEPEFSIMEVNNRDKKIVSYEGREVPFDLLVTIPTNKGSQIVIDSGLGDELGFIDTDHYTLQSKAYSNVFVAGDATNVPASKAGSTAHFETDVLTENIQRFFSGQELAKDFDGHANCFVETGGGKALLIDFNYEVEPLEGKFPFPVIGPMSLLKESRLNHMGKLAFRLIYWHLLLRAKPIPFIPNRLKLSGKKIDKIAQDSASKSSQAGSINNTQDSFDDGLAIATEEEKQIAQINNNSPITKNKE
jgi:sulfide:quinone oxidoreductase